MNTHESCEVNPKIPEARVIHLDQDLACPCQIGSPCQPGCTCINPVSSKGCLHCCRYGSVEQRQKSAEFIAKAIEAYREKYRLQSSATLVQERHEGPGAQGRFDALDFEVPAGELVVLRSKYWANERDTYLTAAIESLRIEIGRTRAAITQLGGKY